MRNTLKHLLCIIALALTVGFPLLAQSPWNGNSSVNGQIIGDASKLTNSGFVLSRSLYGLGAPTLVCSSTYNDGAFYTDVSATPIGAYQCTNNAGCMHGIKLAGAVPAQ